MYPDAVIHFLLEEIREARSRALPPAYEFYLDAILARQARRTRRWERLAIAIAQKDAETVPPGEDQHSST